MYNSLAFYYSGSHLKDTLAVSTAPQLQTQLQKLTNWLSVEHLQHKQWASIVTQQYQQSSRFAYNIFCNPQIKHASTEDFYKNFIPVTVKSSKLFQSQATLCTTNSVFPGLKLATIFVDSEDFRGLEGQHLRQLYSLPTSPINVDLKSLLMKFRVWCQFTTIYLSSYVRKMCLHEENRMSDSFSNCLICKWLEPYHLTDQLKFLSPPFVGPTQAEVLSHLNQMKQQIKRLKAVSQSYLISQLNHMIRKWVLLWNVSVRWQTLWYCDARLHRFLQRWAKRRHPNKGWGWVCHKYWQTDSHINRFVFWLDLLAQISNSHNPVFGLKIKLPLMGLLHIKIQDYRDVEPSSFQSQQFFCVESNTALVTYNRFPLKKWRKSRSFDYFLLY
jgi:hypothetical protein